MNSNRGVKMLKRLVAALGLVCAVLGMAVVAFRFTSLPVQRTILSAFSPDGVVSDAFLSLKLPRFLIATGCVLILAGGFLFSLLFLSDEKTGSFLGRLSAELGDSAGAVRALMRGESAIHWVLVAAFVILGVAVRISYLSQPMRFDEATTVMQYARSPWYVIATDYSQPNNHIFHTLLVHLALRLGPLPWIVRLPAFLSGVALLVASYLLARAYWGSLPAVMALALTAVCSPLVEFSTYARGYSLTALCAVLLLLIARAMWSRPGVLGGLLFVACATVGFYSVPTMLYAFAGAVCLLIPGTRSVSGPADRRGLLIWLGSVVGGTIAAVLILYLPVLLILGPRSIVANEWVTPAPFVRFVSALPERALAMWRNWNRNWPPALQWTVGAGFLVYLARWRAHSPEQRRLLLSVAGACGILLLLSRRYPRLGLAPMWLFMVPVYLGCAAAGLWAATSMVIRRTGLARLSFAVACVVLAVAGSMQVMAGGDVSDVVEPEDYRENESITLYLKGLLAPGDKVLSNWPLAVFQYYFWLHGMHGSLLDYETDSANRLFIIRKRHPYPGYGEAVETILRRNRPRLGEPKALRAFPDSNLLVCVATNSGGSTSAP
ncbi:MAG: hypothetical protein V1873_06345 [Verrucomicrobiota bacterium]